MSLETTRLLIFHPALPPYRVDFFNALARRCVLRIVFLHENLLSQTFDQQRLRADLLADHGYIRCKLAVRERTIPLGLQREIQRFSPDVVVTHEFSPTTLVVLLARALKAAHFAHLTWTDDNPAFIAEDVWLRTISRRLVLPRTDGVVVLSDVTARLYRDRYNPRCPIAVSPMLQDENVFRSRLARVNEALDRVVSSYSLLGKRVLLYVGRLAPEKRVDRLIRAFAETSRQFADAVLALVGDGEERTRLEALSRAAGLESKVIFVGRKEGDELHAWYRAGALFALPSESEAFGAVVNEALLAGMPVVCSDRAGASTLVRGDSAGTVVDASDGQELAAALGIWLGRVSPLGSGQLATVRPSLMLDRFGDAVDAFLDVVRNSLPRTSDA